MLYKLKVYGVVDPILSILKSFLQKCSLKVVLEDQSSPLYNTNAGVPEGSVLGLTLLLIFINDLSKEVLSKIGIYADDELELDLRSMVEWGDRWLVTFNATKMKLFSFNRHRDLLLVPVEMNDIDLPEETSFRLLGLTFTQSIYKLHCQGCFKESRLPL